MKLILVCQAEGGNATAQLAAIARDLGTRGELEALYAAPDEAAVATANAIGREQALEPRTTKVLAAPPGEGGARAEAQEQVWRLVERVRDETDPAGTASLVAGPEIVEAVVCRLLGMPLEDSWRFEVAPASLTIIDFRPNGRTILVGLNEVCGAH